MYVKSTTTLPKEQARLEGEQQLKSYSKEMICTTLLALAAIALLGASFAMTGAHGSHALEGVCALVALGAGARAVTTYFKRNQLKKSLGLKESDATQYRLQDLKANLFSLISRH